PVRGDRRIDRGARAAAVGAPPRTTDRGGSRRTADEAGAAPYRGAEARYPPAVNDFIREIVAADVREGRVTEVVTRFPPEPHGYLHIGHPKSIARNFGIAREFGGRCPLPFGDTNPIKKEQEYIETIQ